MRSLSHMRILPAAHIRCLCSKTTGQYHSLKGTAVEAIGNMTGLQSWQQSGKEEHAQGEAEYNAAQAKGYAEGTVDRMGGKMDAVVGAVTGDRQQEISGESRGFTTARSSTGADFTRRQRPPRQGPGPAGTQQVVCIRVEAAV